MDKLIETLNKINCQRDGFLDNFSGNKLSEEPVPLTTKKG